MAHFGNDFPVIVDMVGVLDMFYISKWGVCALARCSFGFDAFSSLTFHLTYPWWDAQLLIRYSIQTGHKFLFKDREIFFIRTYGLWLVYLSLSCPFSSIMHLFRVNGKEVDKLLMVLSFSPFQMINDTWILSLFTSIPLMLDRVEVFAGINISKACNVDTYWLL